MNAYSKYHDNQILSASPEQILIMLYDGAIRFCRQAQVAHDQQDFKVMSEKTNRTMAIVCEFANTLDHEVGGEIAENLDALYAYMTKELTRANLKKEKDALEVVERLLLDLREGFAGAIESTRQSSALSTNAGSDKRIAASF